VPEKELYTDKATPTRASVLLDTQGTFPRASVDSVQRLVAAAVPDLDPTGVTVSDTKGTLLSSDGGSSSTAEARQALEDAAVSRADSMLTSVMGAGKAVVRVNAELDTTTRSTESESYDPTKTVTLRKDTAKETYNGNGSAPESGTVSVPDPVAATSASGSAGTSTYGKDDTKEEYGVTRSVDKTTSAAGGLKRLTVAVVVDSKAGGLTKQAVTDLVSNAVGVDLKRGDTITVATAPFPADAAAAAGAAGAAAGTTDYLHLATIAIAGLVLLLIALTLLRAARRGSVAEIPLSDLPLVAADEQTVLEAASSRALEAPREAEHDMKVLELVDSRPDEVSSLIRSWLAEPVEAAKK
jgi:flagellar M-ring protein FliF